MEKLSGSGLLFLMILIFLSSFYSAHASKSSVCGSFFMARIAPQFLYLRSQYSSRNWGHPRETNRKKSCYVQFTK